MLIPSNLPLPYGAPASLSRRVNANSQLDTLHHFFGGKLIKKGEC